MKKIDLKTQAHCNICKVRAAPLHFLIRSRIDRERRIKRKTLIRLVTTISNENDSFLHEYNIEELLGEHDFNSREKFKLISQYLKDI